jgi:SAM-dependent methyltransferase
MGKHQTLSTGDETLAGSSLNDWNINPDPATLDYHLKQWDEPYRSTVHFADFIADKLDIADLVVDIGCGGGGPTWYLADRFPGCKFVGLDVSEELINHARRHRNLDFELDDASNLRVRFGVDGVVCMQALHTFPAPVEPLHQIATRIRPDWIALSTLIYEGNINCQIIVEEPDRPRQSYYNVFGLPGLFAIMKMQGYHPIRYKPFKIDKDLPRPNNLDQMQTYTLMTQAGSRLQCSGPLLMPWGFCLFERIK